jgi:WD40 repeat protein
MVGHQAPVYCTTFDRSGNRIITGSDDKLLKVWWVHTGQLIRSLRGHLGDISDISVCPENKLLASGSNDKTIRLWSLETYEPIMVLHGHRHDISSVQFSPSFLDCPYLLSTDTKGECKLWSVGHLRNFSTNGDSDYSLAPIEPIALSDSGRRPFYQPASKSLCCDISPNGSKFVTATGSVINLWSVDEQTMLHSLVGHQTNIMGLKYANCSPHKILSASEDADIRIWKYIRNGQHSPSTSTSIPSTTNRMNVNDARIFTTPNWIQNNNSRSSEGMERESDVFWESSDPHHEISQIGDGEGVWHYLQLNPQWEEQSRSLNATMATSSGRTSFRSSHSARNTPQQTLTLCTMVGWNCNDSLAIVALQCPQSLASSAADLTRADTPPAEFPFVSSINKVIRKIAIFDGETGTAIHYLIGHEDTVWVLEPHPTEPHILLTGGYDGLVILWDIYKGTLLNRFSRECWWVDPSDTLAETDVGWIPPAHTARPNICDGKFSPCGNFLAISDSYGQLTLFGMESGQRYESAPLHQYFLFDYKQLKYDKTDLPIDVESDLPAHLLKVDGQLCNFDGVPYLLNSKAQPFLWDNFAMKTCCVAESPTVPHLPIEHLVPKYNSHEPQTPPSPASEKPNTPVVESIPNDGKDDDSEASYDLSDFEEENEIDELEPEEEEEEVIAIGPKRIKHSSVLTLKKKKRIIIDEESFFVDNETAAEPRTSRLKKQQDIDEGLRRSKRRRKDTKPSLIIDQELDSLDELKLEKKYVRAAEALRPQASSVPNWVAATRQEAGTYIPQIEDIVYFFSEGYDAYCNDYPYIGIKIQSPRKMFLCRIVKISYGRVADITLCHLSVQLISNPEISESKQEEDDVFLEFPFHPDSSVPDFIVLKERVEYPFPRNV